MRHLVKKIKFGGRDMDHKKMMLKNLATSVILYEKVKTTKKKAKVVAPIIEKLISMAKKENKMTVNHNPPVWRGRKYSRINIPDAKVLSSYHCCLDTLSKNKAFMGLVMYKSNSPSRTISGRYKRLA